MTRVRNAAALLLVLTTVTGCGNWIEDTEIVGQLAVGADAQGQPVVVIAPCRSGRAVVMVSGARTGEISDDEENPEYGEWVADRATEAVTELPLNRPGAGWSSEHSFTAEPGVGYLVDGTFGDEEATVLVGLDFTVADLAGLGDDQVLVGRRGEGHDTIRRTDFEADCSQ